jgi:hypothetical protein
MPYDTTESYLRTYFEQGLDYAYDHASQEEKLLEPNTNLLKWIVYDHQGNPSNNLDEINKWLPKIIQH